MYPTRVHLSYLLPTLILILIKEIQIELFIHYRLSGFFAIDGVYVNNLVEDLSYDVSYMFEWFIILRLEGWIII